MKTPYIASEWKTLLSPFRFGKYVNDHTLYYDGKWHLIGITSKQGTPNCERYFVHAEGETLQKPLKETCKVIDTGTLAWAPCVIEHNGLYYMFYGPSPTKLAVSFDSGDWFGHEIHINNAPPMACHRDHFVLKLGENEWVMYVTGVKDRKSAVSCLVSNDLINWDFHGYALISGEKSTLNPSWGAFESPFVVKTDGMYYLFTTYTDCSKATYHNTLVFCSESPYSFGCWNNGEGGAIPVAQISAHAPEIVKENGKWYITTCGWKKSSFTKGKVKIAELKWK
ncbi:MAG: hypothetical protein ACI4JG_09270 [Acutalibacteraceae bacterium]